MDTQSVWVDVARCSGCGACVSVCPVDAIEVVEGAARVDAEACTGCLACVTACAEAALVPVAEGRLVSVAEPLPLEVRRPAAIAKPAAAVVAATGAGLLLKLGGALVRALARWLEGEPLAARPSVDRPVPASRASGGRQTRHRRRGG